MPTWSFTLNGEPRQITAAGDTPLLYGLRDQAGINSPRYGCGQEQCGACRVIVDGELAWACTRTVESVDGTSVVTVEGLARDDDLHVLQESFMANNAAQCGYCLSGILMAASRLLEENPSPDRANIQRALDDHLCRCGAHNRIIRAIEQAAEARRRDT
ncbi:MAG: (2Fe-2S)-binding protein [Pseudomonadales bacterium]|nr:(2Fe-2S)-binding protein [Pseudomonadales bacterium]